MRNGRWWEDLLRCPRDLCLFPPPPRVSRRPEGAAEAAGDGGGALTEPGKVSVRGVAKVSPQKQTPKEIDL